MRNIKIILATVLASTGLLVCGAAWSNEHSVQNCSWQHVSSSHDGYWFVTLQAYRCTLVQSGASITPLTKQISQQTAPMGTNYPGPPTCSIYTHGVYSYSGTCWNPVLVVPTPPPTPVPTQTPTVPPTSGGSCGPNSNNIWGSALAQNMWQYVNQINADCGSCGFSTTPIAGSNPTQLWVVCND